MYSVAYQLLTASGKESKCHELHPKKLDCKEKIVLVLFQLQYMEE